MAKSEMAYVQRDGSGNIVGVFANPQSGYATEFVPDNDASIAAFLAKAAVPTPLVGTSWYSFRPGTYKSATDYEVVYGMWNGGAAFFIGTDKGSAGGTAQDLVIGPQAQGNGGRLVLMTSGYDRWIIDGNANFYTLPSDDNKNELGTGIAGLGRPKNVRVGTDVYIGGTSYLLRGTGTWSNGAGTSAGTLTNAPAVGNPTKWIAIDDNGTTRYIPAW
jgi:hypothetical protein